MEQTELKDKRETIPMMGRIEPSLNKRVQNIIDKMGFSNRSRFVEQAIIEYVLKCEQQLNCTNTPIAN